MEASDKPHASGKVPAGDTTQRVGIEAIEARGVDVDQLIEKLIDAAGAEFTTYYYYTILRMYLAGEEDYKEICEDARLEDRDRQTAPPEPGPPAIWTRRRRWGLLAFLELARDVGELDEVPELRFVKTPAIV